MDHKQRVVTPLNSNPLWPTGFVDALRKAGAQEKNIPHCISWVRNFFAQNTGRRRRDLGRPEIELFLSSLAKRPDVSNWQVQQARDSLELYYEQFRGIALAPRPDGSVRTSSSFPAPPQQMPSSTVGPIRTATTPQGYTGALPQDKIHFAPDYGPMVPHSLDAPGTKVPTAKRSDTTDRPPARHTASQSPDHEPIAPLLPTQATPSSAPYSNCWGIRM